MGRRFAERADSPCPEREWFPLSTTYVNSGVARPQVEYAGFWLRFVALIIDSIVFSVVWGIVTFPMMGAMGLRGLFRRGYGPYGDGPDDTSGHVSFRGLDFRRIILISTVLKWLYYGVLLGEPSSWQATIGKMALGLQVTDLEGHRISFGRASGRLFFGKNYLGDNFIYRLPDGGIH